MKGGGGGNMNGELSKGLKKQGHWILVEKPSTLVDLIHQNVIFKTSL